MPSKTNLTAKMIETWKVIATAFRAHLDSMPSFVTRHAELEGMIGTAESLQIQQKKLKGELQDLNQRRYELAAAGEELRGRMAAAAQAELGFTSEILVGFGVKPRRNRTRPQREQPSPVE
jgi:hypothetical protein